MVASVADADLAVLVLTASAEDHDNDAAADVFLNTAIPDFSGTAGVADFSGTAVVAWVIVIALTLVAPVAAFRSSSANKMAEMGSNKMDLYLNIHSTDP